MGVAFDPNKTIKIPTNEPKMIAEGLPEKEEPKPEQYEVIQSNNAVDFIVSIIYYIKPSWLSGMEMEAALGEKEKRFQISSEEVHFCTHMMDTYGENYKAMARDSKNYFQLTPKQIRNRIRSFKRSKEQYQKYLNKKKAVEQPDEETNTSHAVANDNMEE